MKINAYFTNRKRYQNKPILGKIKQISFLKQSPKSIKKESKENATSWSKFF